jgi:hypothetical protein
MARNKKRKPKYSGPTPPRAERNRSQMHDAGPPRRRYDPGKNPQPRSATKERDS